MSDWLVAECVLPWLVARPPPDVLCRDVPRLWQIRSVVSFGEVCRRLHGVVCGARAVWAAVDIGDVIGEIAGGSNKHPRKIVAAGLRVLKCVPRPVLAACGAFSSPFEFPLSCVLAFVLVMPALTRLSFSVIEQPFDVPRANLVGLFSAADVAEWRGRGWWPADATDEKVTVAHLLRAISSLPCLTDLTAFLGLEFDGKVLVPVMFPRLLRKLTVQVSHDNDVSALFGAGPHDQIEELQMYCANGM
jgi:hypothetical protein